MTAAAERPSRLDARALRDLVLDPGSWRSWDSPIPARDVSEEYARELAAAAAKTRQDESIITGEGLLRGRRVAVVAGEFGFLAGSIGVAAADRLIRQSVSEKREHVVALHLARRRALYGKAVTSGDLRTALAVLRDDALLRGLYPDGSAPGASAPARVIVEIREEVRHADPIPDGPRFSRN